MTNNIRQFSPVYNQIGSSVDKLHLGNPWVNTCRCMCRLGVGGYGYPRGVHPGWVWVGGSHYHRYPGVPVGVVCYQMGQRITENKHMQAHASTKATGMTTLLISPTEAQASNLTQDLVS